jgi:tetratricopeptide (TPR) repeat protein
MPGNIIHATYSSLMTGFIILLFSCNQIPTEADAIKQNQDGINYMNEGKYELALAEFTEAIKTPRLSQEAKGTLYRNIGLTYHELNKIDSSLHYYTIAAKTYRKNSYDYLVNMASVDLLTGKVNAALSKLNKAAAIDPDDLIVNNSLGLIYLGDYGDGFIDVEKALVYNKKAFEVSNSRITEDILGRNYYEVGNYELAEMHYEKILGEYPDVVVYNLNTGMIKYKLNKINEGDQFFRKVLEQDSTYKETIDYFKENNQ